MTHCLGPACPAKWLANLSEQVNPLPGGKIPTWLSQEPSSPFFPFSALDSWGISNFSESKTLSALLEGLQAKNRLGQKQG